MLFMKSQREPRIEWMYEAMPSWPRPNRQLPLRASIHRQGDGNLQNVFGQLLLEQL